MDLRIHDGFAPGNHRFRSRRRLAETGESRAARCQPPIRPTSSSSFSTRYKPIVLAFTAMSARRLRIWSDLRSGEFASILPGRPLPGPWRPRKHVHRPLAARTRKSVDDATSGKPAHARRIPSATMAMRPPVSSPISFTAPRTQAWPAASLITKITSWKNLLHSGLPGWLKKPQTRFTK